jgi:hypothetical protein
MKFVKNNRLARSVPNFIYITEMANRCSLTLYGRFLCIARIVPIIVYITAASV